MILLWAVWVDFWKLKAVDRLNNLFWNQRTFPPCTVELKSGKLPTGIWTFKKKNLWTSGKLETSRRTMEKLWLENKTCAGSAEFYHQTKRVQGSTHKQPLWLLSDCWRWEKPSNLYSLSATLPTFTTPHFPATAHIIGCRHFPITAGDKNQQITRPFMSTGFSCSEWFHIFLPLIIRSVVLLEPETKTVRF